MCVSWEISYSISAKHPDLAGKFHTALSSSETEEPKCFSLPPALYELSVNAVKLSSFCLWSSHHVQQLHLHINELSHSSSNCCAGVPVLSPPCFLFLCIYLSWLCSRGCPELSMREQQQQSCKQRLYNPFYTGLTKSRLCPCALVHSAFPADGQAPAQPGEQDRRSAALTSLQAVPCTAPGTQHRLLTHRLKVQTAPAAQFQFLSMLV